MDEDKEKKDPVREEPDEELADTEKEKRRVEATINQIKKLITTEHRDFLKLVKRPFRLIIRKSVPCFRSWQSAVNRRPAVCPAENRRC